MENVVRRDRYEITNPTVSRCLGVIQIILALAVIGGGALVLLKATPIRVELEEAIFAFIRLILGSLLLLNGIIWVAASFRPKRHAINGVNLGFAIVSILAALALFSINCIAIETSRNCNDFADRCKIYIAAKKGLHSSMLFFSIILAILSVLNIVICSRKCCCINNASNVEQGNIESTYQVSSTRSGYVQSEHAQFVGNDKI